MAQDTVFSQKIERIFDRNASPLVMGILNITPDSFFDGEKYTTEQAWLEQTRKMIDDGADMIDIGAYSTRPGAKDISEQEELEQNYKVILKVQHGIVFNHLYTITNMPINRFADTLNQNNGYDAYYKLLFNSFNPKAAENVMCKNQLSISWNGEIFDCDFNQALNIPLRSGEKTVWDIDNFNDICKKISFANHCYGP